MTKIVVIPHVLDDSFEESHFVFNVDSVPLVGEYVSLETNNGVGKFCVSSVTHVLAENKVHIRLS